MDDVIVIGGGIVGASAAYRLARCGARRVRLVDRADAGQATAAGAGILSPGTSYKPPAAFFPLAFRAVAYYETLLAALAEDGETDTGFETVGLLHVATSEAEAAALPVLLRLIEERRAAGAPRIGAVQTLTGDEARTLFPALGACVGAIHISDGARVDGRLLRDALRRAAERRGARFVTGAAGALREAGSSVELTVNGETLAAGAAILAGGAWSGALAEPLGVRLPVFPQRGQILHLRLPDRETARWPIVVGFHSHYLLTFPPDRVVAGATRESDAGFDARMTAGGVSEALAEALRVAPALADATLVEVRVGLRPASPDGLPLLGRLPGCERVYIATGHGASGLQLGPYSGALVADLALGQSSDLDVDLTAFAPARFAPQGP